jgi:NTP pyrophosphatase (non-canonical NTP hydrolase)
VRPDDWAAYTVEETDHLLDWLDQYDKDLKAQEAELKG